MYITNNKTIKNNKLGVRISISVSWVPNWKIQMAIVAFLLDERVIWAGVVEFVDLLGFVRL